MSRLSALWVRNLIGVLVVAAAVAIVIVWELGEDWTSYRRTVEPETVVGKGETGEAAGQSWKLASVKHLNTNPAGFGPDLPEGTVLRVVTLDRSGTPPNEICAAVITDGHRSWKSQGIGGFGSVPSDGVTTLCNQPGPIQFTFLLPADVVPTAMDVVQIGGQITIRMML